MVRAWQDALRRCVEQAVECGHLRADTDPQQMVYEMYGLVLALHHEVLVGTPRVPRCRFRR